MDEEINVSFLSPIGEEGDKSAVDLFSQVIDGVCELMPDQQIRLQHISTQAKSIPPNKDIVTITENNMLDITNVTGVCMSNDVESIFNSQTPSIEDPSQSIDSDSGITPHIYQELLHMGPMPTDTIFEGQLTMPVVENKMEEIPIQDVTSKLVNQANYSTISKPTVRHRVTSKTRNSPPTLSSPATITLPQKLPSGCYVMKHFLSDPSMVELCFPDQPHLKPLKIPIDQRQANQPARAVVHLNVKDQQGVPGSVTPTSISTQQSPFQLHSNMTAVSSNLSKTVSQTTKPPMWAALMQNTPRQLPAGSQSTLFVAPSSKIETAFQPVSTSASATSSAVTRSPTPARPPELRLGMPVQLSAGSASPIRTPIKVGCVTYLPVGIPMSSANQGPKPPPAIVSMAKVSSGLAMTSINTAVPIQIRQNCTNEKKAGGPYIEKVKIIDTVQGPKLQTVMNIGGTDKNLLFNIVPSKHSYASSQVPMDQSLPTQRSLISKAVSSTTVPSAVRCQRPGLSLVETLGNRHMVESKGMADYSEPTLPTTTSVKPHSSTDGLPYAPKVLLVDSRLDVGTEEVKDMPHFIPSMRTREQSHKMVSVTVRDNCIHFKNEARYISEVQLKHKLMKSASKLSQAHNQVKNKDFPVRNCVVEVSCQEEANYKSMDSPNDTGVNEGSSVYTHEASKDVHSTATDEALLAAEKELESDRIQNVYKQIHQEQNRSSTDRMARLDQLIGKGPTKQALYRLFRNVPQFVDDPLIGDTNTPMYFCCYLCPFASFNEAKVCVHWTLVHVQQNPYVCGYCSARFNSSGKAHRHLSLAHPCKKVFIKIIRSDLFSNPIQFEFIQNEEEQSLCPLIEVGSKPDTKKFLAQFACKECSFTSKEEGRIMQHVRENHFNISRYSCIYCNQGFRELNHLQTHIKSRHDGLPTDCGENPECAMMHENLKISDFYDTVPVNRPVLFDPDCIYWITEENINDRDKKRYTCTLCSFKTKRVTVIWKHVREEHGLPEGVFCKRCSCHHHLTDIERNNELFVCYTCCTLTSLKVTGQSRFIQLKEAFLCIKCSLQMEDLVDMKRHIKLKHSDVYPYMCSMCRAKFVIKQEALRHGMEMHRTQDVIQKQSSLVGKLAQKVRKLHIRYMYSDEANEQDELAQLWKQHGLQILRAGELKMGEPQATGTPILPKDLTEIDVENGNEGGVSIVQNVDVSYQNGERSTDNQEFSGIHHYRCRLCPYQCLDRSCMARHVKYMHLRIHPHSCPFCGYSNVEKTKVKIHIVNLHGKSSKKVRTNTTLVTALGEESKKHFVRVFPNGREIRQEDVGLGRGQGSGVKEIALAAIGYDDNHLVKEIKLEPVSDAGLDDNIVEHLQYLDRDLKVLEARGCLRVEDKPSSSIESEHQRLVMGQIVHIGNTAEEMEVDTVADIPRPKSTEDSVLYNMLRSPGVRCKRPNLSPVGPLPAKKRRMSNYIYPVPDVMADDKLRMLPLIVLQDVIANYFAGRVPILSLVT